MSHEMPHMMSREVQGVLMRPQETPHDASLHLISQPCGLMRRLMRSHDLVTQEALTAAMA